MATLVLGAVGAAVAGPAGWAVGALAGRQIDGAVLGRPVRDGPRLAELRVQGSSYGTPMPRLYGCMRVAGTVIWSTDLEETRTVSRRKGQPDVASYSYRASFAVLLSARPIVAVGRVWADGNLLRGAAGDLKTAGTLRLHLGTEDQAPDPLIASAEGTLAPAHRGHAYAVFEDLALGDFGNRLPSLSFEVFADDRPVRVGAIAADLADVAPPGPAATVEGFAVTGGTVRATLELLGQAAGGWWAPDGAALVLGAPGAPGEPGGNDPTILPDERVSGTRDGRRGRTIRPAEAVPRVLMLGHYDPARDHQAGVQRATRPGAGWRETRLDMPAVIGAPAAKAMAAAMLARAEAERTRRTLSLGLDGLTLSPGAIVQVPGGAGPWRVEAVALEGWATTVTLLPIAGGPADGLVADPGRVLATPDRVAGRTVLHLAELPPLDESGETVPRVAVMAAGEGAGWRGAALLLSIDGGASWQEAGGTAAPAIMGVVEEAAGPAPSTLIDRRHALVVRLLNGDAMLGDVDAAALDRGANLALVGDELLQFGRATPLGHGRWRLWKLWRGRRGTEGAAPLAPGDRFVLLAPGTVAILPLPGSAVGARVAVMAVGPGDDGNPVRAELAITGASLAPPSPVALRAEAREDGGVRIRWTRRSRRGWRWLDGVDAPIGEERELYQVTLGTGPPARVVTVDTPMLTLAAAERGTGPLAVAVRQLGTLAASTPATIVIEQEGPHA